MTVTPFIFPGQAATGATPPSSGYGFDVDTATGLPFVIDSAGVKTFTIISTEGVQDIVGSFLTDSTVMDFTYDDAGNIETVTIKNGVVTAAMLNFDPEARAGHTGTQTAATISDFTEATQDVIGALLADSATVDYTYNDAGNLQSIAVLDSPTVAGQTPANLRDRTTHTGVQTAATISDFTEASQDVLGALLVDSATIDYTYNDAGNAESVAVITTGLSPATSGAPGIMSAAQFKKLATEYDIVNDLGADATGVADFSGALQTWHDTTIGSNPALLIVPAGALVRINANVNFTKSNIRVLGANRVTSGFVTNNAAGNMFTVSGTGVVFDNVRFKTFADNAALRTSGYAVEFLAAASGSGCYRCDAIFMWSCFRSSGPLQFFYDVACREYGANAINGACVLVDSPGDRYMNTLTFDSTPPQSGHAGIRVNECSSLTVTNFNLIHCGNCLELTPSPTKTIASVNFVNGFFDNSINGIVVNGTAANGSVFRSKFTHFWCGTMSQNGILLNGVAAGTAQFDGISFSHGEIFQCTTAGINAPLGGGKWVADTCKIAACGSGINITAGTNHFPEIRNCTIGGYGAFGVNTTGIVVGAGTYRGLVIQQNDVSPVSGSFGNTTVLTLGAVTVTNWTQYRVSDNTGINPRGAVTTPALPATTVVQTNTTGFRVQATVKWGATAPTAATLNGVVFGANNIGALSTIWSFMLEPGGTWSFTGTAPVAQLWVGQ